MDEKEQAYRDIAVEQLFCRTYWGSHGCTLPRGHDGPCICSCAFDDEGEFDPKTREYYDDPGVFNVGLPPYYGPDTHFYGEDAPASPPVVEDEDG